jgi:hypothetical protein
MAFGLTKQQVCNARGRYNSIKNDCEWESLEDYISWMLASGFQKGMHIAKLDETKPHGPRNSYWLNDERQEDDERLQTIPDYGNALCDKCELNKTDSCPGTNCLKWQEWWVDNWDRNFHREVKHIDGKSGAEHFVYHHPDDIREGRS